MSAAPTWEEMEEKRQDMISSFKDIASAMTRCVSIIEDYARLSPSSLSGATPRKVSSVPPPSDDAKKPRMKREKKFKDPNAPKRPPSAYILFQNEVREEMRNAHPGIPYKDVLGLISSKWKDLPEEQKKVYEGAYTDASATYRMDEAAYNKDGAHGAVAPPATHIAAAAVSDESESDDTSDDSDDTPPITTAPVSTSKPKVPQPPASSLATQTPPTLQAAAHAADGKKEKKRKIKEDEAAVVATLDANGEKKKKKKKDGRVE